MPSSLPGPGSGFGLRSARKILGAHGEAAEQWLDIGLPWREQKAGILAVPQILAVGATLTLGLVSSHQGQWVATADEWGPH